MWSLLSMVFYFCWGAVLVSTARNLAIRVSHDEAIDLYAGDRETLSDVERSLKGMVGRRL